MAAHVDWEMARFRQVDRRGTVEEEMLLAVHHPCHGLDPGVFIDLVSRAVDRYVAGDWLAGINVIVSTRAIRIGGRAGAVEIRWQAVDLRFDVGAVCNCRCSGSEPQEAKKEE